MAIKKDAAKADIGPKKQVKATFAECKAVEPLKCKYHGLKALDKMIGNILASSGHPMPFVTDKHDNEYELRLPGDIDLPMSTFSKISLSLANKGFSIYNKGQTEEGAFKYQIKPVDGKEFVTPDGEAEKEDADTLSVEAAPEKKKEDPFAELENMDVDALLNDSELDADLMDNFDELEEVAEEATEDLEEALLGNSDFDDEIFGEGDKEASQSTTEEDYEKFVGKLIKDPFPPFLKTDAKLLKELVEKGTMNGTAPSKANIEEWEKAYGNGQGPDGAVKDAVNAAFAKLKEDGKEKAETPPTLSVQDIKDLVSFKGVKEENFEQNPGLEDTYNAIITTGKNPNGNPLTENQVTWWNDLLDKTKEANPDELPALGVLKRSLEKVGVLSGEQNKKTLTDDDIVAAFSPAFTGGNLATDSHYKDLYKSVITNHLNPNGKPLTNGQLEWFKKASEKAHAAGINNYAVELLDKMLEEKGMLTKQPGELSEIDKEKYYKQWNNLMDTAINGKNLMGTQYWAETISPILDDYNEGLANNDGIAVSKAISELQAAVNASSDGKAEKPTKESLIDEMQSVIDKIHNTGLDLTWDEKKGMALGDKFGEAINANDIDGASKALENFKAYIKKLETGDEETKMEAEQLTADDIKDFFKQCGIKKPNLLDDKNLEATKTALETGKWLGKPLTKGNKKWYKALAEKVPDHKVAQAINAMLESGIGGAKAKKQKFKNAISETANNGASPSGGSLGVDSSKEALLAALNGGGKSMAVEGMLQPLEHDDAKFPQKITQDELDDAISKGKTLGGHGGLGTKLIEIDGKKYVCKSATGTGASVIKNGYNADMAYRAGGVYAPDAKLYTFDDGKVYKLSEFIPGKRLIDVWQTADEAKREEIRKDLLKGYPLDVLFSNYDVLGTSPEDSITVTIQGEDGKPQKTHVAFNNIMIGDDGHAYRVDNDGSFAMTGTGGIKGSSGGGYTTKVESEKWGNWEDRQWIDDFRTMRRNEKNLGIFDRYSTADIFLSAANIDLGKVVSILPKGIQDALAKPVSEMKEMGNYAKGTRLAGYPPSSIYTWKDSSGKQQAVKIDPVSTALDAIYEANKSGVRPFLQKKVSWVDTGWLSGHGGGANYVPVVFPKPEPKEPKPPAAGTDLAKEVLEGIKTINYHAAQGNGNVNQSRIDKALAVKPMVEMLAEAGNDRAKGILEAIGKIEESIKNGHGKEIKFNTDNGFFDVNGLSIVMGDKEKAVFDKANEAKHKIWEKEHKAWEEEKEEHDRKEKEKAKKAGAAPTKSFQEFEDNIITAMIDTDGVKHGGGDPSINHSSKSSQKDSSFNFESSKKKVRQYAMMGIPLDQMYFENSDPTFYNGHIENGGSHVSGGDGKPNYYEAVQFYQDNPEQFRKDMESYARHKGMMALVHTNMDNDAIDRETGTIFVMRGEHPQAWGKDGKGSPSFSKPTIIKPWAIDSSTSACINETGHFGGKKVGWKLPIWRVTDNFMIGHGSEQEICINPINIPYPAMYFPNPGSGADGCKKCQDIYSKAKEVIAVDKKLGKEV